MQHAKCGNAASCRSPNPQRTRIAKSTADLYPARRAEIARRALVGV
jgi:hypothetical protein